MSGDLSSAVISRSICVRSYAAFTDCSISLPWRSACDFRRGVDSAASGEFRIEVADGGSGGGVALTTGELKP